MTTQLDEAIKEISTTLQPEDVFSDEDLVSWARRKKLPMEIYSIREMRNAIDEVKMEIHL